MTYSPGEFIKLWRDRKERLQKERRQRMELIVLDLIAQIRFRVRETGINSFGTPFPDYVQEYKQVRALAGYQIDHVDITRSGRTLNSIQPEVIAEDVGRIVIEAAPRTERGQRILRGLSRKRPRINYPSDSEVKIAAQANSDAILRILTT